MRRYNIFNFIEKKVDTAKINALALETLEEISFRELAIHIAVSYIANTLSKCEIKTYENGKEERKKLYYMLNVSPNPNENSSQFINKIIETYFLKGEALVVPVGENIYCADDFTVDETNPLKEYTFEEIRFGNTDLHGKRKANEVFRFKLDNQKVKELVDLLYTKYGKIISLALESYKRTNGKKYKFLIDGYQAGDQNFQKRYKEVISEQLKSFIESDNAAVMPLYKGTSLEEFSTATPQNSNDIIALRKEIFEVTAQAFKIPLSMMNGNITNMNDIVKVYLSICIDPLADMIGEELTRKYYSFEEWKNGYRIEVDTSCINHIDILEVAEKVDKAISSGLCNIDEMRKRVNLEPLNTEFSTSHFITKNYDLAERVLKSEKGGVNVEEQVLFNGNTGE